MFREFVSQYRDWVLSYVVLIVSQIIEAEIAGYFLIKNNLIQHPTKWYFYESAMTFIYTVTGSLAAIVRLSYFLCYVFFSLFRLDYTILPHSVATLLDRGYCAFMATAVVEHTHHNPYIYCAADQFTEYGKKHETAEKKEQSRSRAQKRWQLGKLLVLHPSAFDEEKFKRGGIRKDLKK
eukprot:c16273_g1_i2.p1 GENE.c16273_g1_i2~~c16273_g1_i2.p1  ORF type:complete len:179 (+),score=57.08 c16273_g1_i2:208-744(+)